MPVHDLSTVQDKQTDRFRQGLFLLAKKVPELDLAPVVPAFFEFLKDFQANDFGRDTHGTNVIPKEDRLAHIKGEQPQEQKKQEHDEAEIEEQLSSQSVSPHVVLHKTWS